MGQLIDGEWTDEDLRNTLAGVRKVATAFAAEKRGGS